MSKLKTSWLLIKQSCIVIGKNKKLLFFPLINYVPFFFIVIFCFLDYLTIMDYGMKSSNVVGIKISSQNTDADNNTQEKSDKEVQFEKKDSSVKSSNNEKKDKVNYISFPYFALIYFVTIFYVSFSNVAFFNEIIHALNGQPVSILGGIKFALWRWKSIFLWSLLASTVGIILNKIGEKFGFLDKLIIGLIGIAWSVASIFAIPVIIREENSTNPIKVLTDSGNLIKKTWGEGLIGYLGFSLMNIVFISTFALACLAIVGVFILKRDDIGVPIITIGLFWLVIVTFIGCLLRMVEDIFKCALYLYASEGEMPLGFEGFDVNEVWKVKTK